jgi:hypothetical protein
MKPERAPTPLPPIVLYDDFRALLFHCALEPGEQREIQEHPERAIHFVMKVRELPYSLVAGKLINAMRTHKRLESQD